MTPTLWNIAAALVLALTGLAPVAAVGGKSDDGWTKLFNGKDLTGWDGDVELWSVQDGAIIGKHPMDKTTNRYLCTKENYGDFVLRVSWKLISPKGNSGVQVRGELKPTLLVAGYQVEIASENSGGIYEELGRGWLQKPSAIKSPIKPGDWNQYVITAKASQVVVEVNGTKVVDLNDKLGRKSGIIALQHYQGEVRFKDIKLKKLKAD